MLRASVITTASLACTALAQVDPLSGIDFVTIGDVGNPNWTGGGFYNNNHGRVDYEFKIGRFEVTTAQWVEFTNAYFDRATPLAVPGIAIPYGWGAVGTTPLNGGRRWRVPAGREMIPTGGITWRMCAIYCNWLHNNKGADLAAFMNGAYDVSTFSNGPLYTDQLTRSPGARYWIPSLDEWMKAAHWDPSKDNGDGTVGGWWRYPNGTDVSPVYGPPGVLIGGRLAEANAGWSDFNFPGYNPFAVPLGAYQGVVSPFGLVDAAGGTAEWTEFAFFDVGEPYPRGRFYEGSARDNGLFNRDLINGIGGGERPNIPLSDTGFRIATVVPAPGCGSLVAGAVVLSQRRRR